MAARPALTAIAQNAQPEGSGTILTGEMFAPTLRREIARLNDVTGKGLSVVGVPNTYFGGDVSVAGLLSGRDYLAIAPAITSDFVIIPKHTIKSDEPIMIDGMMFEELVQKFPVPIFAMDTDELFAFLSR